MLHTSPGLPAMTQNPDTSIRRRPDGSIDHEHYDARARDLRATDQRDAIRAAGAYLLTAARNPFRLAQIALGRA